MMNPPFKSAKSFVKVCEDAYERDKNTAPLLILPNDGKDYFKEWAAENRWLVCHYLELGAPGVFSQITDGNPFHLARDPLKQSVDHIMACLIRPESSQAPPITE